MTLGDFIAAGRQAEVYAWDDGNTPRRVLKLFFPQFERSTVQRELDRSRSVAATVAAAPVVSGDIIEWDGRLGIIYERVDGVSMIDLLSSKPWRSRSLAFRLAELHVEINRLKPAGLPPFKDRLRRNIESAVPLTADQRDRCLERLAAMPDGDALCHGDFHPGNVILRDSDKKSPVIIDWPNSGVGDPLADVAHSLILMTISWRVLPRARDRFLAQCLTAFFHRWYTGQYCKLTGASRQAIQRWKTITAAARLADDIPEERNELLKVVRGGLAQA